MSLERQVSAHFDHIALIYVVISAVAVFCLLISVVQALLLLYYSV